MQITRPDAPTSRGLLAPLLAAASLLVVIAATVNLFPGWVLDRPAESTEVSLIAESPVAEAAATTDEYVPLTGLIDPHNGDNGTDPAQTTTGTCNFLFYKCRLHVSVCSFSFSHARRTFRLSALSRERTTACLWYARTRWPRSTTLCCISEPSGCLGCPFRQTRVEALSFAATLHL